MSKSDIPAPLVRLVDDDPDLLAAQAQAMRIAGFHVETCDSGAQALQGLSPDWPGVLLSDVRMPGMDGFELFARIRAIDPDLPVILLTGHGDVPMAVAALRDGVYDFLTKPASSGQLAAALARAASARALVLENRALRHARHDAHAHDTRMVGDSSFMHELRDTITLLAERDTDVLLLGQTGTGKETTARAIHRQSNRRSRTFVHLPCASLDEARFDAEMLGQDAAGRQPRVSGRLERAHRGTLYLDGVDGLTAALQARLLALLEAKEVTLAGTAGPRAIELHIVSSAGVDLPQLVREGKFRADLFYRLSGVKLVLAPLAERRQDVPALFHHFLLAVCARLNLPVAPVTGAVKARLAGHSWPGNLHELAKFAEAHAIGLTGLEQKAPAAQDQTAPGLSEMVATFEAELIRDALNDAGGNATRAMERLRLPRKTFYDKLNRHNIRPSDFRETDQNG